MARGLTWPIALLTLLALACSSSADPSEGGGFEYPKDGELRLHQLQLEASHNSYHVAESPDVTALAYSHAPLGEQLSQQGVRGFELDTRWDWDGERFVVYHLPVIDDESTCYVFADCLAALRSWSDANPAHHALFVQIEPKDGLPPDPEQRFAQLEAEILAVWPRERILAPDDVRGSAPTLRDAVTGGGWPTLGEARGKVVFFFDERGDWRQAYTRGGSDLDGRLVFVDAESGEPYEAIHVMNDPIGGGAEITAAVQAGLIVRTRADADNVEPPAGDTTRRDAALASGAQIISTDYPSPVAGVDYVGDIPGGTPSRCNPLTAPAHCTSEDVENPVYIR